MYSSLETKAGQEIAVLLNAFRNEHDGEVFNDFIYFPMKERYEYEQVFLAAKKETDDRNRMREKQIAELDMLRQELESEQKELFRPYRKVIEVSGNGWGDRSLE
ncbi:hypothetical protein ABE021_01765 [Sporosarcina gallistercoris]|uniref:hypothetical protein n=1 Tax=Sporosarcina gallistercoris TaxID=2762245 RepID=UPI003D2BD29F